MCKLKSAIILKDRVFIPDYDSHDDMLEELGIKDTKENASRLFVRAELSPKDGDIFSNIETWDFNIDQDILPEWFVAEYEKKRMIEAVKEWSKSRIHIGIDNLEISDGGTHYIKDCKNVTCNNSTVTACNNSTVMAYGNSTVKAYGNSTVIKTIYSSFNKDRLTLCENSTFKDCKTKTIYQSGDWKFVAVNGKDERRKEDAEKALEDRRKEDEGK